jgi:hypothetical protein
MTFFKERFTFKIYCSALLRRKENIRPAPRERVQLKCHFAWWSTSRRQPGTRCCTYNILNYSCPSHSLWCNLMRYVIILSYVCVCVCVCVCKCNSEVTVSFFSHIVSYRKQSNLFLLNMVPEMCTKSCWLVGQLLLVCCLQTEYGRCRFASTFWQWHKAVVCPTGIQSRHIECQKYFRSN